MHSCRHDGSWLMKLSYRLTMRSLRISWSVTCPVRLWRAFKAYCLPGRSWPPLAATVLGGCCSPCSAFSCPPQHSCFVNVASQLWDHHCSTPSSFHSLSTIPVCWIVCSCARLFGSEKLYLIMRASIKKSISSCSEQISGRVCGAQ